MMNILLMFGPEHGRKMSWRSVDNLPNPLTVPTAEEAIIWTENNYPTASYGSIHRHMYDLQEIFDQGMDEVALYIHSENCCERPIPHERNRNDRPRIR
jgi:hypothetical protein